MYVVRLRSSLEEKTGLLVVPFLPKIDSVQKLIYCNHGICNLKSLKGPGNIFVVMPMPKKFFLEMQMYESFLNTRR